MEALRLWNNKVEIPVVCFTSTFVALRAVNKQNDDWFWFTFVLDFTDRKSFSLLSAKRYFQMAFPVKKEKSK
jgi:hypothetical protein